MKVVSQGQASLIGGVDAPVNMGISDDPEDQLMILNVLSNSLYTDKIAAVLREYGCNAFDANIEAGRGHQPIEVRLPNKLDPTLSIRDFGYGMSEAQILNVFCRLGRSTKRQSNAFTGMLGIGSKAGFAYGDEFLVTSYCNGTKAVYNCFRDQGAPRLSKMHEAPSDAADGIEVKVPIRMDDFVEFVIKAERIYRYFKVRPIIHGVKLEWKARGVAEFAGTGWRYTGAGESVAIMGNVGYALSASSLPQNVSNKLRVLIDLGVELDFEIGDLEIAANREGLQYKDHTIKSIVARLDMVATEVSKVFTDRLAKAPSLWDAHRMYADDFEKLGQSTYGMRTLKEVVQGAITWNGVKITTGRFDLHNVEALPGIHVVEYHKSNYYRRRRYEKREEPSETYASVKTQLVINDLPSKANSPARVAGFFEANKDMETLVTFTFVDAKVQAKYWKARGLAGAPTINLSTVTPWVNPNSAAGISGPSAHRAKHSAKVFKLVNSRPVTAARAASIWWEQAEVDLANDSGIYVLIDKFKAKITRDKMTEEIDPRQLLTDTANARTSGLLTGPIYGFKASKIGKLGPGWKEITVFISENLDTWFATNKQSIADADAARAHKEWIPNEWMKHFTDSKTAMHKYLRAYKWMLESGKSTSELVHSVRQKLNSLLPLKLPTLPKPTHDLDALSKVVRDTYPFLHQYDEVAHWQWSSTRSKLLIATQDYVKAIGK